MIPRHNELIAILLLIFATAAMAAFSSFVVITPENEAEHRFLVQVQAVADSPDRSRVRVVGAVVEHLRVWLVICRTPVHADEQHFRYVFWFDARNENIERYTQLFPEQTTLPESGDQLYSYVEAELSHEQMRRAYIYIDHPRPVDDGGYYYSIDLAYYLEGDLGKKSELLWGGQ